MHSFPHNLEAFVFHSDKSNHCAKQMGGNELYIGKGPYVDIHSCTTHQASYFPRWEIRLCSARGWKVPWCVSPDRISRQSQNSHSGVVITHSSRT